MLIAGSRSKLINHNLFYKIVEKSKLIATKYFIAGIFLFVSWGVWGQTQGRKFSCRNMPSFLQQFKKFMQVGGRHWWRNTGTFNSTSCNPITVSSSSAKTLSYLNVKQTMQQHHLLKSFDDPTENRTLTAYTLVTCSRSYRCFDIAKKVWHASVRKA